MEETFFLRIIMTPISMFFMNPSNCHYCLKGLFSKFITAIAHDQNKANVLQNLNVFVFTEDKCEAVIKNSKKKNGWQLLALSK